ncbi:protein MMS22-like [Acanthaster planci]|uniref:Protein MMS22-like n=1 Tax=Acanthaster planci TaxID=133434 RepID=A0A8B7ZCV3_ACAPL|nr:protein MMS22-like [Acanthaster planci]
MDLDLEYSITPPLSPCDVASGEDSPPSLGQSLKQDSVQCLACVECFNIREHHTSLTSTLKRILLGKDPNPECFQDNTCELFGHTYVTGVALLDATSHLFCLSRQCVTKIQSLLGQGSSWGLIDPLVSEAKRLHGHVMTFMKYVQAFIYRYFNLPDATLPPSVYTQRLAVFPSLLVTELQTLSMFNGRISELPVGVLQQCAASSTRQDSTGSLLLHMNLSTQWSIVQVLHLLQAKLKGEQDVLSSFNEKAVEFFQDLLNIATLKYNKIGYSDHHQHGSFPDGCLQDLWSSLIHLLDSRHNQYSTDSFWCSFHSCLLPLLDEPYNPSREATISSDPPPYPKPRDPVGLCWWLLQYVAPLCQYDPNGQLVMSKQGRPVRSYWLLVEDLLKIMFTSNEAVPDEARMQTYLRSCLVLCHLWEPKGSVLTLLWGHFHKRLNKKLIVPGEGVKNLASICQTPHSWYDHCKERIADHTASRHHENSFDLFLHILATQLKGMKELGGSQGWKQLQGRFYSKFHSRSMKELDETGLSRFLSLFLTFALVTDLSDVTSRMLDFLDLLPTDTLTHGKLLLIWRGLFTFCLVHEDQSCDLAVVADRLVQGFNTVSVEMCSKSVDSGRKSQLWALVLSYMEATQEVFDASNKLHLSEEKLIGSGLSNLLEVSSEHEMRALLTFLQTIMARHRSLYQQVLMQRPYLAVTSVASPAPEMLMHKYKALAKILWDLVYPFIKRHASTQTPPSELADVATSFTLLAADLKLHDEASGLSQPTSQELFHFYGLDDHKVHYSITVRYLCHLLPNHSFTEQLQAAMGHTRWASSLIHTWLRCGLQSPQAGTSMQELTRLVFKLEEASTIMDSQSSNSLIDGTGNPHKHVMLQFIQALGHQFNSARGLQERVQKRQTILSYFGDLVELIQPMLRNLRSASDLSWIYKVVGHIIKCCSSILYVKGKSQAQLPGILTELILPPALFNPKKGLPSHMLSAIRETLHLFLEGLASLDLQRNEFIQRKIQEIVQQYFHRFQVKNSSLAAGSLGSSSANHPLMVALHKSCARLPNPQISALRELVLKVICQQYLIYHGQQPPSHLPYTLAFLQELLHRTSSPQQIVRDTVVLLGVVLDYLLLCDVNTVKKSMMVLLTAMMDACRRDMPPNLQADLLSVLRGYLSKHLRVHQAAVLLTLETVAVQHPALVTALIGDCSRLVSECEHKRGVGADSTLRQAYCSVLSHLGEAGEAVISKIKGGEELVQR